MSFSLLIHHGRFGAAVQQILSECADLPVHAWNGKPLTTLQAGAPALVALGTPDIPFLQRIAEQHPENPVVGVFLFERYLAVTPMFGPGQACCECFLRRFLSQPPFPYSVEASEALISLAGIASGHESLGFTAMAVRSAIELAQSQLDSSSERCILVDLAGTAHQSARLVALHGCACRIARGASLAHPERFIHFQKELKQWPAQQLPH